MKINLKQISITFIAGVFVIGGVILAGSINNSDAPDMTYVSLNNIYEKLITGATSTEKSFSPLAGPASTMKTLSEIYEAIPAFQTLNEASTTLEAGIYATSTLLSDIDTDLDSDNIADGVEIFGVTGNLDGAPAALEWSTDQGTMDWNAAVTVCAGTVDGITGWRLPYVEELTMESPLGHNPTVPFWSNDYYWTDKVNVLNPNSAYYIVVNTAFFVNGCNLFSTDKGSSDVAVRCVK